MKPTKENTPFQAGAAHVPEPLAGRDKETEMLTLVMDRLSSPRAKTWGKLAKTPYSPVKIVGPRGVGKTALLGWAEEQAKKRGIRCVSCEGLRKEEPDFSMQKLLAEISIFPPVLRWIKGAGMSVADKFGASVELNQLQSPFTNVAGLAVRCRPLLLLLDEVQHYELPLLRAVLQGSQRLIRQGYPLGLVLAGTPGMESHLDKAESTFIVRGKKIYINALSDAATRAALRTPFEQEGVTVAPDALEAMAAQTDNYPYFIQVVGEETWKEMASAGRKDVDVAMVRRIEERARKGRNYIYNRAWIRMLACDLMPYAHQVIDFLDRNEGRAPEKDILDLLRRASRFEKDSEVIPLYEGLQEDGLIWTENGETKPGIPSFFSYCKAVDRAGRPSSDGGFQQRNWLPDFLPGFFLRKKNG